MKMQISETEFVTQAEHVANVISGTGSSGNMHAAKALVYRCPINILVVVDSMASQAKKSRNAMINLLLQVGIDEVRENLDVSTIEKLSIAEAESIEQHYTDDDDSISE